LRTLPQLSKEKRRQCSTSCKVSWELELLLLASTVEKWAIWHVNAPNGMNLAFPSVRPSRAGTSELPAVTRELLAGIPNLPPRAGVSLLLEPASHQPKPTKASSFAGVPSVNAGLRLMTRLHTPAQKGRVLPLHLRRICAWCLTFLIPPPGCSCLSFPTCRMFFFCC